MFCSVMDIEGDGQLWRKDEGFISGVEGGTRTNVLSLPFRAVCSISVSFHSVDRAEISVSYILGSFGVASRV